jgi:glycosyltransferase involved in cell wall biosynthesis
MRVAYVTSRFPAVSETFVVRELDAVAGQGLDVEVIALFPTPPGPVHEVAEAWLPAVRRAGFREVVRGLAWWLRRRPHRLLSSFWEVARGYGARRPGVLVRALVTHAIAASHARWVASADVDRVHAHFASYGALAAWTIKRLTGTPYSFTAHAHDLFVHQIFLRQKVADADVVVAISEFNREFLRRYGGDVVTPVRVVRCGIDVDAYAFRIRALPVEAPVRGLCVASLEEYKGHGVLLDALALHGRGLERLSLTFVGSGRLRPALERRVRALGLGGRIRFAGALPQGAVLRELERADVFVLPSVVASDGQMEGVPVALMEAMACGVPVVSTELSGIPELVRPAETGVLARPGDPASLAAALRSVLDDPETVAARCRRARALVEAEFDLAATGAQMAALLRGAPAPNQAAAPLRRVGAGL